MGKKRIIKAYTDKAGSSVGVENLSIQNNLTVGGIVGKTDGVAVSAGNIGEILSTTTSTTLSGANWKSVATLSLTPGIWVCRGTCELSDGTTARTFAASISATANGAGSVTLGNSSGLGGTYQEGLSQGSVSVSDVYVNISSTTTYHLNIYVSFMDGAGTNNNYLQAVRIA